MQSNSRRLYRLELSESCIIEEQRVVGSERILGHYQSVIRSHEGMSKKLPMSQDALTSEQDRSQEKYIKGELMGYALDIWGAYGISVFI